jgi:hypothetical protein
MSASVHFSLASTCSWPPTPLRSTQKVLGASWSQNLQSNESSGLVMKGSHDQRPFSETFSFVRPSNPELVWKSHSRSVNELESLASHGDHVEDVSRQLESNSDRAK